MARQQMVSGWGKRRSPGGERPLAEGAAGEMFSRWEGSVWPERSQLRGGRSLMRSDWRQGSGTLEPLN